MKPNLFEIAKEELTQDGFIHWLLEWANPDNKKYDEKLNACAVDFIKFLIDIDLKVENVTVYRQVEGRIDILVYINKEYLIIIEDKVNTHEHDNQLEENKKKAKKLKQELKRKPFCIYLKTGTDPESLRIEIRKKVDKYIDRSDLIKFFEKHNKIENDIYNDFIEKIKNLEEAGNAFTEKKIKEWVKLPESWKEFYEYLVLKLGHNTIWKKANPLTGEHKTNWDPCCLLWPLLKWKNKDVRLSIIADGHLRIDADEAIKKELYGLLEKDKKMQEYKIKPIKSSNGVAKIEYKDWLGKDDEVADLEKVVKRLKEIREELENALK